MAVLLQDLNNPPHVSDHEIQTLLSELRYCGFKQGEKKPLEKDVTNTNVFPNNEPRPA